jgi:hypothetical protein
MPTSRLIEQPVVLFPALLAKQEKMAVLVTRRAGPPVGMVSTRHCRGHISIPTTVQGRGRGVLSRRDLKVPWSELCR